MSDVIGTFWIVTGQNDVYALGDSPLPRTRDFSFRLTEENFNSWGCITLMARSVTWERNKVVLNGHFVGYLDPTPNNFWVQQTFIVEVFDTQKFGDGSLNNLVIESFDLNGETSGDLDNFEIKHIRFDYRTNR